VQGWVSDLEVMSCMPLPIITPNLAYMLGSKDAVSQQSEKILF
jgi:hypothetical protein